MSFSFRDFTRFYDGWPRRTDRRLVRCNNILLWLICFIFSWPTCSRAGASAMSMEEAVLPIDAAVQQALDNNPALQALKSRTDAMQTLPAQVGSLPDPVVSLNAMNLPVDTFDLDQEPMTQMQLALSQGIPFFGKRKLRREIALQKVQATDAMVAEGSTAIVGQVRAAWWQLMQQDLALMIVQQNKILMRDFVNVAQAKYRVGSGLQQDVLLAQLELSRLLDRELKLNGMRIASQAELNALMGRPGNRAIKLPERPPNADLPALPHESQLLRTAARERALIDVQRKLVSAARADLELAKRDRYPDFRLGVGYGFRQGTNPLLGTDRPDLVSVMLSFNVPIFAGSKQSKAVEQRAHEISQQTYAYSDALRSVESSVARYAADYSAAKDQVVLLETAIIPQAQQTVASMLAAYRVNEVDFLNVVNTQITLYNAQINYWEMLARAKQSLARLAAAVGEEALYE
jgi:outer membrane protein TolC